MRLSRQRTEHVCTTHNALGKQGGEKKQPQKTRATQAMDCSCCCRLEGVIGSLGAQSTKQLFPTGHQASQPASFISAITLIAPLYVALRHYNSMIISICTPTHYIYNLVVMSIFPVFTVAVATFFRCGRSCCYFCHNL